MSSSVTVKPAGGVRGIGLLTILAGIVLLVAGAITWYAVHDQLAAENITVSEDADFLPGDAVDGPFSAYAQADIINHHAMEASGGKTYAELDQDDPTRGTVMNASFLRASLFTSVVAFGVAALVMGLGIMFILIGVALRRVAGGSQVSVEGIGSPAPAAAAAPAAPAAAAPQRTSATTPDPAPARTAPAAPSAADQTSNPGPANPDATTDTASDDGTDDLGRRH